MLTPELETRRRARRKYDDLVRRGVLTPEDRVELIAGRSFRACRRVCPIE
jgi:hypothetical protein